MKGETQERAVIYCRVSSKAQDARGDGLNSQERACRDFARMQGLVVDQVFYDKKTGGVTERPGMQAMLAFLRKHRKVGYFVIVDDIDRWARDVLSHWQLRASLAEAGGRLISRSMEFGETSDLKLVENIRASVAQHARDHNRDQTLSRMASRARNGWWPFAIPIGYRYVREKSNGKVCVRDEPLASVVQEGLEGFASDRFSTQADVLRFFESRPEFPRDRHGRIAFSHVRQILERAFYAGFIDHPGWDIHMVPARHEPLISLATHKAIQDKLAGRAKFRPRTPDQEPFPLRGSVLCQCGTPLTACYSKSSTGKLYAYYLCPDKSQRCPDYRKSIPQEKIEGEFAQLVEHLAPSPGVIAFAKEAIMVHWEKHVASGKRLVEAARQELAKIERSIDQLTDRIVETEQETVVAAYERKLRSLEMRRAELTDQVNREGEKKPDLTRAVRTAVKFLANPSVLWTSGDPADRRVLLKLAFPQRLTYSRNEGFRTPLTGSIFRYFASLDALKKEMARPERFERPTLRFVV
ncbi:MAG: recombinase family protein [Caulobacteraceae bacterium]|nr:recombinase family protein [Caulobacteraceae bacterium]